MSDPPRHNTGTLRAAGAPLAATDDAQNELRKIATKVISEYGTRIDLPEDYRIEKTVFIKAPRSIPYGEVAKVIDSLKGAGAEPVGLQLDDLN